MREDIATRTILRVLQFLEDNGSAQASPFSDGKSERIMLSGREKARMLIGADVLGTLRAADLISHSGSHWSLTPVGQKRLLRARSIQSGAAGKAFQDQHRNLAEQSIRTGAGVETVSVNLNESPLHRLRSRKTTSGEPWLSEAAFRAGERLRLDFTRGQLEQKITSSWDPSGGRNKGRGLAGGKVEITDQAIDARKRMQHALDSLGPDLSGVITDVCCFLKGLESVERERRWPPRSAKLMLRAGLELLARHYGTATTFDHGRKGRLRSWGAEGYRPNLQT